MDWGGGDWKSKKMKVIERRVSMRYNRRESDIYIYVCICRNGKLDDGVGGCVLLRLRDVGRDDIDRWGEVEKGRDLNLWSSVERG